MEEINRQLDNTHDGNVYSCNESVIKINGQQYTKTISGVYVSIVFECLTDIPAASDIPFITIDKPSGKNFSIIYFYSEICKSQIFESSIYN